MALPAGTPFALDLGTIFAHFEHLSPWRHMAQSRKRGQVISRGKDTYLVRYYIGRDPKGKRKYRSSTVKGSRQEAQKVLTKMLRDMDTNPVTVEPTKATVEDYVGAFVQQRTDILSRTRERQQVSFRLYIKPFLGTFKMKDPTSPPGIQCDHPSELADTICRALADPPAHRAIRARAVEWAYGGPITGDASERAAAAIMEVLDG